MVTKKCENILNYVLGSTSRHTSTYKAYFLLICCAGGWGTCPLVQMELVCVGAVQAVGDEAMSPRIAVRSRHSEDEHVGRGVLHHHLRVHKLAKRDASVLAAEH